MSRRYSSEQWEQWIGEQQASGLSIADFCESIGVSQNAFYVRRRQLAGAAKARRRQPSPPSAAGFVSLKLAAQDAASTDATLAEVQLPGGVVVRVCDRHVVRDVIAVVLEHGGAR